MTSPLLRRSGPTPLKAIAARAFEFDDEVQRLAVLLSGPSPAEELVEPAQAGEIRALLDLTNPIERHRAREAPAVPAEDDYVGDHKEYILGPFARPTESRFSDGSFGVLYAGRTFETALDESVYWTTKFLEGTRA